MLGGGRGLMGEGGGVNVIEKLYELNPAIGIRNADGKCVSERFSLLSDAAATAARGHH